MNQRFVVNDPTFEMVAAVPLFTFLERKRVESICNVGKRLHYDPSHKIVKEGEKGIGFYLILDGEVEIRRKEKSLAKLGKGQFFGEMALLDNQPRSADVIALKPTTCFGLTSTAFQELMQKQPQITLSIIRELAHRLRESNAALFSE
jgi:CRP/FNR family cyclic AMP-dependent transcriptional regulator